MINKSINIINFLKSYLLLLKHYGIDLMRIKIRKIFINKKIIYILIFLCSKIITLFFKNCHLFFNIIITVCIFFNIIIINNIIYYKYYIL